MKINCDNLMEILIYLVFSLLLINMGIIFACCALILSFIAFLIYLSKKNRNYIYNKWIYIYFFLALFLFLSQLFREKHLTHLNLSPSFIFLNYGLFLFLLPLIFPIYEILCVNEKQFLKNLNKIGIIILIIKSLSWVTFNFLGRNIGFGILGGRIGWNRVVLGHLFTRMSGTPLDGFLFSYSLLILLSNNSSKKLRRNSLIEITFLFLYTTIIFQTRAQFFFYIVTLIASLFFYTYKNRNLRSNLLLLFLLIFLTLIFWKQILNFVGSFSINSNSGGSTAARVEDYTYFPQWWRNTSLTWGFGFYDDSVPIIFNSDRLYISDVGILMQLYQFGIIGFLYSLIPIIIGIFSVKRIDYKKANGLFFSLLIYMLVSSINVNPYISIYYPIIPIYIAIMIYTRNKNHNLI